MERLEFIQFIQLIDPHHRKKKIESLNLIDDLTKYTDFLCKDSTIHQRIWHVVNECFHAVICPVCGDELTFIKFQRPYNKCCDKCKKEFGNLPENIKIRKEQRKTTEKTWTEKYGTDNIMLVKEVKEKLNKTSIERHGKPIKDFLSIGLTDQVKSTLVEKYGNNNPMRIEKIKEKVKRNNIIKFGVEYYVQTDEFKEKAIETCTQNYNSYNFVLSEEFKEKIISGINSNLIKFNLHDIQCINVVEKRIYEFHCKKCNSDFTLGSSDFHFRLKNNHELCTTCNPIEKQYSVAEKQIFEFVSSIYDGEIIENTRLIIPPLELDIYIPEKKIAIEYNGLYFHSEANKDKNYHKMKSDLCRELGIHLVHIFEDDWKYKNGICKSVIKNFLGVGSQTIVYGRKCVAKDVDHKTMNIFLENNHMLGKITNMTHCIGLYNTINDELVSLMAFRLISKESGILELSRYAVRQDTNIKGGAEKIWKHFLKTYGNLYNKVKTFNDNGVFKGNVHYRLGFTHTGNNPPNYMYYDKKLGKRVSKQSLRKIRLSYKQDEQQFIETDRYFRVYNAGNDTCEFIIDKIKE